MNYRQIIEHCEEASPLTMAARLMCEAVISARQDGRLSDDEKQSLEHAIRIVLATQETVENTRLRTLGAFNKVHWARANCAPIAKASFDEIEVTIKDVLRIGFGLNGSTDDIGDQWG